MPDRRSALPRLTFWRAFVPRWAYRPLSGDGASKFGGRWNPVGCPALYCACELSTAWAEYNQGFVQHPALIAQLELTGAILADLSDPGALHRLRTEPDIHRCEWRALIDQGRVPPTHALALRLKAEGYDGLIYPSAMSSGGTCVALWRWNETGGPTLSVVDPESRLPRTPASWIDP